MTDNEIIKMTDNEIIKAMECCHEYSDCGNCQYGIFRTKNGLCVDLLHKGALNLFNRQKAEIDTLKAERNNYKEWYLSLANEGNKLPCKTVVGNNSEIHSKSAEDYDYLIASIKSEAIQEFAEKLKSTITINNTNDGYLDYAIDYGCLMEDIDNLVKEMTVGKENEDF